MWTDRIRPLPPRQGAHPGVAATPDRVVPTARVPRADAAPADAAPTAELEAVGAAALLDALLAQLPCGVVIAGRDGRPLHVNAVARRLRDDDAPVADERPGAPPGGAAWALELAMARALLTGEAVRDEAVELQVEGRRRWLRVSAAPVRDADGAVTAGVLTVTDDTARRHEAAWAPLAESLARL